LPTPVALNMPLFRAVYNPPDPLALYLATVRSARDKLKIIGDFHVGVAAI
jgi:hypothetical protein